MSATAKSGTDWLDSKEIIILDEALDKKQNENEHNDLNISMIQEENNKSMTK